jgi:hypothetical protein
MFQSATWRTWPTEQFLKNVWMVSLLVCRFYWQRVLRHVLSSLEHWDFGFESCSRHGYVSAFLCVVFSCVGRGLASGWSPVQGVLPNVHRFINSEKLILSRNRPWGLILEDDDDDISCVMWRSSITARVIYRRICGWLLCVSCAECTKWTSRPSVRNNWTDLNKIWYMMSTL